MFLHSLVNSSLHVCSGIPFSLSRAMASTRHLPVAMRSCFFPKKTRHDFENVKKFRPDVVILDLEDSIELHEKPSMRKLYLDCMRDGIFSGISVFIRSSSLNSYEEIKEDIYTFTGSGITGFFLPKVETPESILEVESLLAECEREKGCKEMSHKLVPIIETPSAHFKVYNILSSTKRIVAIVTGSGDFTAEAVCDDHSPTYDTFFSQAALAAKSTGKIALWGVHDKIDDHIGFEFFCLKMKRCGYQGVIALTPKQITLANQFYSLSHAERDWTDQVLRKSDHLKLIQRSVQESRQMIGPPHRLKARNILANTLQTNSQRSPQSITGKSSMKGICPQIAIGEVVSVPHEALLTESWLTVWESAFISSGGYGTKYSEVTSSANKVPLPFSLAATMAVAFSVANLSYNARVHLGFKDIFQQRPLLTGDRVHAMFRIDCVKSKKSNASCQYSVLHSTHWLINQDNKVVVQLEKITMFQPEDCKLQRTENMKTKSFDPARSLLRSTLLEFSADNFLPLTSQQVLTPGILLIHDLVKVIGYSETRMLCNLLHIVNPHHHNIIRYQPTDLLVPGPFVMSAGMSIANQDIGEVIYEDIPVCTNPNKVNFGDQLGAMTFIVSCKQLDVIPEYEEVTVKHFVLRNTDPGVLSKIDVPLKLFENGQMKPSEYESICAAECPILLHKIACVITRRIIRVRPGFYSSNKIPQELFIE